MGLDQRSQASLGSSCTTVSMHRTDLIEVKWSCLSSRSTTALPCFKGVRTGARCKCVTHQVLCHTRLQYCVCGGSSGILFPFRFDCLTAYAFERFHRYLLSARCLNIRCTHVPRCEPRLKTSLCDSKMCIYVPVSMYIIFPVNEVCVLQV